MSQKLSILPLRNCSIFRGSRHHGLRTNIYLGVDLNANRLLAWPYLTAKYWTFSDVLRALFSLAFLCTVESKRWGRFHRESRRRIWRFFHTAKVFILHYALMKWSWKYDLPCLECSRQHHIWVDSDRRSQSHAKLQNNAMVFVPPAIKKQINFSLLPGFQQN